MVGLFDPVRLGDLELANRIIMAPLTRCRAVDERTPNALMRDYYVQRASAGLIISEATSVTPMGVGYPHTPGVWSDAQVEGWSEITKAVRSAGGAMLLQLWHVGRVSHPLYLNGALPEAPSAIAPNGFVSLVRPKTEYVVPRALEREEIPGVIAAYKRGAENAMRAGFDGVHIHGANGYLLDQFLQDGSNRRTDDYGGSLENRARLMLEVADACIGVWGADRVSMHLAPRGDAHSMGDTNRSETFAYVARELGKRKLAFLCTREKLGEDRLSPMLKREFGGRLVANEGFDRVTAQAEIERDDADAVAFGKLFIANPDLPARFAASAPLNAWNSDTFYTHGPEGYVDYPKVA